MNSITAKVNALDVIIPFLVLFLGCKDEIGNKLVPDI